MLCPSIGAKQFGMGPNRFWNRQNLLDYSKLFWMCPNQFGHIQK
jgi:hypothetical protein